MRIKYQKKERVCLTCDERQDKLRTLRELNKNPHKIKIGVYLEDLLSNYTCLMERSGFRFVGNNYIDYVIDFEDRREVYLFKRDGLKYNLLTFEKDDHLEFEIYSNHQQ